MESEILKGTALRFAVLGRMDALEGLSDQEIAKAFRRWLKHRSDYLTMALTLNMNRDDFYRCMDHAVREKTLQSEEPEINIFSSWRGTKRQELDIHQRFDAQRVRGEWFNLTVELINGLIASEVAA